MKYALATAAVLLCGCLSASLAADSYLTVLQSTLEQAGSNLTALAQSAQIAATQFVAGGDLWVAGRQEDFIAEACGRAGGLLAIAPLGHQVPKQHDIVLYSVPGALAPEDQRLLSQWREQGTTVIPFSSPAGLYKHRFPLDTVMNVADLWTWTGEFVAACTRLGKMPVLYQSYGLPGGRKRASKYKGKRFHDDLSIQPIPPGVLGREYRDQIQGMLKKVGETQMPKLLQGAKWWREASSTSLLFTGHMFPRHVQDPRTPSPGNVAAVPAWDDKDLLEPKAPPQCVIYVGYQFAPQKLIAQAQKLGVKLVYFDVEPGQPPEPASNILYLDPAWPLADGCVSLHGYDIPILPASGVVDAAIYWTMRQAALPDN